MSDFLLDFSDVIVGVFEVCLPGRREKESAREGRKGGGRACEDEPICLIATIWEVRLSMLETKNEEEELAD